MKNFGLFLAIFGFLYSILALFELNSVLVTWIDNWGESFGWAVRGSAILFGILIYSFSTYRESNIQVDLEET